MSRISTNPESAPRRWRQFSLRSLLLLVFGCALFFALLFWWLRPAMLERRCFPMGVGYRWVYESKTGDTKNDVVFEVVGVEKVGDAQCFVVLRTIGDHQLKFYVEVTKRAVLIHQVGQERYHPAYPQFVFGTKQGDTWDWKGKIGNEPGKYACTNRGVQPIGVPLGQYNAFVVRQVAQGDTQFWLADGVGVVKLAGKTWDKHDPLPQPGESSWFDWQLKEFFRPPP
jgi:hypothetical protein